MTEMLHAHDAKEDKATDPSEVTFHLAPRSEVLPFRWVAGITTPHGSWRHRPDSTGGFEPLTVDLPGGMSHELLEFARRHLGPDATDPEIDYWCHTYAHKVGTTALRLIPTIGGGEPGLADAKARSLFLDGTIIPPSELAAGEHAVVGDANPNSSRRAPFHSMVGIGPPKGDKGPNLAAQIDTNRGNMYVGDPADYLEYIRESGAHLRTPPKPQLYVQRTPRTVSGKHSPQDRKDSAQ